MTDKDHMIMGSIKFGPPFVTPQTSKLIAVPSSVPGEWIKTSDQMPPDNTEVLILYRGKPRIGIRLWDMPGHEDTYVAHRYWDDPDNDGQDWHDRDIVAWAPIPAVPKELLEGEKS